MKQYNPDYNFNAKNIHLLRMDLFAFVPLVININNKMITPSCFFMIQGRCVPVRVRWLD